MSILPDSAVFAAVLDAAVRGTFILLAALGATKLMRRSSASARHLVWLAALTALLLLPLARSFVPEWRVLPAPAVVLTMPPAEPGAAAQPSNAERPASVAPSGGPASLPAAHSRPPQPFRLPADWKTLALLAWAAGAGLFGLRLVFGVARVRWMERRATELTDEEWVRLTDGLSRRLRLGRIVRLLREPAASVPMTWGIFRPVILLPGEADAWEGERRRVVLAHELAHVRRWDALTQWLAHLALAVYWFNPLVWVAARRLREEREHACDDAVLEIGTAPAEYADHLLTIVRSLGSAPGPAAALAMARRSQFEGRLLAILDHAVRRNGVSRTAALATTAAALACLLPLAAMRPVERAVAAVVEESRLQPMSPGGEPAERVAEAAGTTGAGETARNAGGPAALTTRAFRDEAAPATPGSGNDAPPAASPVGGGGSAAPLLQALEARRDPGLYAEIIRASLSIESSTDRRMVLTRLLEKADLSHDNVVAIIGATRTMPSDTDKRAVLDQAVRHRSFRANPLTHVFYEALRTFDSSTDQRAVLTALLETRRLDPDCLVLVFQHLPRLGSDTDARVVLTRALQTQRIEGSVRAAYLDAARAMDSDTDRAAVLSALMGPGDSRNGTAARPREDPDRVWTTENHWEGTRDGIPFTLRIQANGVVIGSGHWDVRRIQPGGNLLIEERFNGTERRVRAVPGRGGQPSWTYTVNGLARPFDAAARRWMQDVIRNRAGG